MARKKENITTIKITKETKNRLDRLKEYPRETYEEVLKKLFYILNTSKKNPERAQRIFKKIDTTIKRKERYSEVYQDEPEEEQSEDQKE
jgi:hypothetical protein